MKRAIVVAVLMFAGCGGQDGSTDTPTVTTSLVSSGPQLRCTGTQLEVLAAAGVYAGTWVPVGDCADPKYVQWHGTGLTCFHCDAATVGSVNYAEQAGCFNANLPKPVRPGC